MISTATPRTYGRTSIASKIGWRSKDSRHGGRELFRTRKRYLGLSCRHVRADDKVMRQTPSIPLALGRSVDGPNTPGPRVGGETTPMVVHELTGSPLLY